MARSLTPALYSTDFHVTQSSELELAHKRSIRHRAEIEASELCGCFYCCAIYPPRAITAWTDWPEDAPDGMEDALGQTALCPKCGIDSVLGSASGFPITPAFLKRMNVRWFQTFA
jgi:hypothetical protein